MYIAVTVNTYDIVIILSEFLNAEYNAEVVAFLIIDVDFRTK
jgi:hypothetical protein